MLKFVVEFLSFRLWRKTPDFTHYFNHHNLIHKRPDTDILKHFRVKLKNYCRNGAFPYPQKIQIWTKPDLTKQKSLDLLGQIFTERNLIFAEKNLIFTEKNLILKEKKKIL